MNSDKAVKGLLLQGETREGRELGGLLGLEEGAPLAVAETEGSPSPWLWLWSFFKPYLAHAAGCAPIAPGFLCGRWAEHVEDFVVVLLHFVRGNLRIGECLVTDVTMCSGDIGGGCLGY